MPKLKFKTRPTQWDVCVDTFDDTSGMLLSTKTIGWVTQETGGFTAHSSEWFQYPKLYVTRSGAIESLKVNYRTHTLGTQP